MTMQMFMLYLHDIWATVVLVPLALAFVWMQLNWVSLVCVFIMILTVPLQVSA